jgi:N-6 DNA methylase
MTVSSQRISEIISAIVTLDSQEPKTGKRKHLASVMDFACGSGSLLLNVRKRMGPHGIGKIFGQEKNITTYKPSADEHAAARGEGLGVRNLSRRHADRRLGHPNEALGEDVRFKTTDWLRSRRLTSRSCCTSFTTSRMTA